MKRLWRRLLWFLFSIPDPDDPMSVAYDRPRDHLSDSAELAEAIWRQNQLGPH